ncbi:SMP-30/gluconolactonase/LRE family protein [Zobellia alginiliquefaciens]|uniref:SMP-30/gluconolactonase/LRE family protein n=1 Tax=Zobellia alginiliquefaciens TaxID=3032586 RepID=UPI0023E398D9|nr:SMP-30/gluconolactonase/LRE family protein [Zobellia alginiliquefaciens]
MSKFYMLVLILGLHATLISQEKKHLFSVEILDDEALSIIDENAEIKIIGSGFTWTEGPLWIADGDYLLFSDIPNNTVFKIDALGKTSEYLKPSGYLGKSGYGAEPGSNGLLLSPEGKLILMQHGERRVAQMTADLGAPKAEYVALADSFKGKRFNSPNDGVFDADGNLYFTDPPYGLPKQMEDSNKELDYQGVYCLKTSGEVVLVDKLSRPNGVALSNDGSKLYVAVSNPEHAVWYQYDIFDAGTADNKKLFYDVTNLIGQDGQQGLPDGMKMHSKGYLFATGPGGVWVFNETGKALARIHTGEKTANCAFGKDEKVLYLTADDYIMTVSLK